MITFGKYKGMSLKEIAYLDMGYIKWCFRTVENFDKKFDTEEDLDTLDFLKHPLEHLRNALGDLKFDGSIAKYIEDNELGRCEVKPVRVSAMSYSVQTVFGSCYGDCDKDTMWETIDRAIYNMIKDKYIDYLLRDYPPNQTIKDFMGELGI